MLKCLTKVSLSDLSSEQLQEIAPGNEAELLEDDADPLNCPSATALDILDVQYANALLRDPLQHSRDLTAFARASGQRRADFKQTIEDGNKTRVWEEPVPVLQLLRDCPTRWSSTRMMGSRFLVLFEASSSLPFSLRIPGAQH